MSKCPAQHSLREYVQGQGHISRVRCKFMSVCLPANYLSKFMKKHVPCRTKIVFTSVKVITIGQLPGERGLRGHFVTHCNISFFLLLLFLVLNLL